MSGLYRYLMVSLIQVHLRKYLCLWQPIQQFVYLWYRVSINFCLLIQESVIDAHSQCALFFPYENDRGTKGAGAWTCIQPRSMYLHNYFQISANSSLLIHTVGVLVVICAHLLGLFYVWCFCPLDNLVFKTHLYSYHTDFPNDFLYVGVLQVFHCPVILGAAVKLGANCLWVWA